MPVTSVVAAYGTALSIGGNPVAELTSITGPSVKLETIDATNFASPDTYREFIGGMRDGGDVGIEGNFIPGDTLGQIVFMTYLHAATIGDFIITFPTSTGTTWTFKALVTAFETKEGIGDKLSFTASLKVTAKPVLGVTLSVGLTALTGIEDNGGAALVFVPAFLATKFLYVVSINTASTWVKFTCTAAGVITIKYSGIEAVQVSTVQSGALAVVDGVVTKFTIHCKEATKAPIETIVYVGTPL